MMWSHHIQCKVNKATKVLNFIKRILCKYTKEVKTTTYFTLVKPLLDYAAMVWDPYQQYLIDKIEMIQWRAARWVMNDYHLTSSISDMLSTLKWPSLQRCRLHSRLSMFYKFINEHALLINIPEHYNPRISACLYHSTPSPRLSPSSLCSTLVIHNILSNELFSQDHPRLEQPTQSNHCI